MRLLLLLLRLLLLLLLRGWRLGRHGLVEGRLCRVLDAVQPGGLRDGYPGEGRRVEVRVQSADRVAHWKKANTTVVSAEKTNRAQSETAPRSMAQWARRPAAARVVE